MAETTIAAYRESSPLASSRPHLYGGGVVIPLTFRATLPAPEERDIEIQKARARDAHIKQPDTRDSSRSTLSGGRSRAIDCPAPEDVPEKREKAILLEG